LHIEEIEKISDEYLYESLLNEFPGRIKDAKKEYFSLLINRIGENVR
jgi:hypothetical protein